jgi:hypothetical protein
MKKESLFRPRKRLAAIGAYVVGLLLMAAAGCAKQDPNRLPVFPTKGQVTFQGRPAAGALVVLHPKVATPQNESIRPRAYVKEDGTFELSSYESSDGAPVGDYAVVLVWPKTIKSANGEAGPGPNVLPPKYARAETSPTVIKIAEGPNQLQPIILK